MTKNILVTGGAGYIGSHMVVSLVEAGYNPIIFDNFSNSKPTVLNRIEKITGKDLFFIEGDIRSESDLDKVLRNTKSTPSSTSLVKGRRRIRIRPSPVFLLQR